MKFKRDIESLTLYPDTGGVFEVTVDGETIFSKKATGRFPEHEEILTEVRKRL